jgi:SdrD B-like domain
MVVAFRNRDVFGSYSLNNSANAAQTHYLWPAGEVLRACSTNGTSWQLESNGVGTCPGSFTRPAPTGAVTHLGPGGSEFYLGDGLDGTHNETIAGGIIQVPGHANLQTSMNDPTAACSAGFASLKNSDGSRAFSAQLYADGCSTNLSSRFGKANGIGDLEALCDEAPLEIGNRIWKDLDGNGVQDPGEPPVGGVTVNLYKAGVVVGTATTAADGTYLFGGVTNVNMTGGLPIMKNMAYSLRLDNAANFTGAGPLAGTALTQANAQTNAVDGIDSDATKVKDPTGSPAGSWPTIDYTTGGAGFNNHTLDYGFINTYAVGNRVWIDTDNSGTINATEAGVDGVEVKLYAFDPAAACGTGTPIATQTTTGGGYYRFDDLPAGKYKVVVTAVNFTTGKPLAGYASSTGIGQEANPDLDGDNNDNGINGAPGADVCSGMVTLGSDGKLEPGSETDVQAGKPETTVDTRSNLTVDFGFTPAYSLGNRVFLDGDNSGNQGANEAGIDGVEVKLYPFDAAAPCGTGTAIATTTTSGGGYYRFDNLPPGKYRVVVTAVNFTTGKPLAGYTGSTGTGQEANPDLDVDTNDNGIDSAAGTDVCSGMVTLGDSAEPTGEKDVQPGRPEIVPDNRSNLTVDFGFRAPTVVVPPINPPSATTPPTTVAPTTVAPTTVGATATTVPPTTSPAAPTTTTPKNCNPLSGTVYVDVNKNGSQDPNEPGIPNATVTITSASGVVTTVTTDVNGAYSAPCLDGPYTVTVSGGGISAGAKPTDGSLPRSVTVTKPTPNVNIGFAKAQVKGVEIDAQPDIAFTGTPIPTFRLIGMAFGLILVGSAFIGGSRPKRRTVR